MRYSRSLPLIVCVALLAACDADPVTAPPPTGALGPQLAAASLTSVEGVVEVVGETGPGSTYALFRPESWNGGLVVWAHGYVQPFLPVALPAIDHAATVRDHLLESGFAVAYSSYSENGYAVKDAAQRTHQLSGLFAEAFGTPARTYLVGISMGGLVAEMLSERYPSQYDGTVAACPLLSGAAGAEYVATVRVLFDWLFQDAAGASPLPGSLYSMPEGYYLIPPNPAMPAGSPAFQAVVGALTGDPGSTLALATMNQVDLQFNSPGELISGLVQVLGYQINGANALNATLHGHGFFDNRGVHYASPALDGTRTAALNDGVARYEAEPPATNYLDRWWEPTGDIRRPFLTLHTTRDPLVPFRQESGFRTVVDGAGNGDLLVQRSVSAFGHCTYGVDQLIDAVEDLILWVETGLKPAA